MDRFIEELKKRTQAEIETRDESFTSEIAQQMLSSRGVKRKKQKGHVDRLAACQLLQSYLDEKKQ